MAKRPDDLADNEFTSRLVELDEALAGETPAPPDATSTEPLTARLRSTKACLELIERVRRTTPQLRLDAESDLSADVRDYQEPAPERIGRFEIIRELGRGGYGVVFLAHDSDLERDVALKVPRPEVMLTPELRQRFVREAKAAAALDHAHVVPVFEAGTIGSISYLASAFCPGTSLSEWLDEHSDPIAPGDAARLVMTLAEAVQHAHSRGVVHRDLNPRNILLEQPTEDGACSDTGTRLRADLAALVPKISDFGLARFLDVSTNDTRTTAILGTPAYMAPEQAAGRAKHSGPAADVYALGAILYELLTRTAPFRRETDLATLQAVQTEDPRPVRSARTDVPRDLEAICSKCLEKEPSRRYASATNLASDLNRFLHREPVVARPVTTATRFGRWCRRNPALATLGITLAATLLLGIVGVTWQWRRAEAHLAMAVVQRTKAEDNLAEADRQRQQAEENFRRAHQAVDDYFTLTSENSLLENPTLGPLRIELLRKAQRYYEGFVEQRGDDPQLQAELAASYIRLSSIVHDMGGDDWLPHFEKGLEVLEQLDVEQAPFWEFPSWRRGVNNSRSPHLLTAQPERAWKAARRGIAIWKELAERHPQVAGFRTDLAALYSMAGMAQYARRNKKEMLAALNRAHQLRQQLADEHPGEVRHRYALGESLIAVGMAQNDAGDAPAAQQSIQAGCTILEELSRENPRATRIEMNLAWAYQQLAAVHVAAGRAGAALAQFNKGLRIQEGLARDYPAVPEFRLTCAQSYHVLGDSLDRAGFSDQAKEAHAKALDFLENGAEADRSDPAYREALAVSRATMAGWHYQQGRTEQASQFDAAAQSFTTAVDLYRKAYGKQHPTVARSLRRLAGVEASRGEWDKADTLFQEALAMQRRVLGAAHPDLASSLYEYAKFLRARGEYAVAETHFRQAVDMQRELYGDDDERVAVSSYRLGDTLVDQGKLDAARQIYRQSWMILREIKPDDDRQTVAVLNRLARTLQQQDDKPGLVDLAAEDRAFRAREHGVLFGRDWTMRQYAGQSESFPAKPKDWNAIIDEPPLAERSVAAVDLRWRQGSTEGSVPPDNFATVARGTVQVPAGQYELHAAAKDGVRIAIDGEPMIDHWKAGKARHHVATVTLDDSEHQIDVDHFHTDGDAELRVWFRRAD